MSYHKKRILVTGGAGFVGSNLIECLLSKTNKKILSIDNYSSGSKKNHIKNPQVKYFNADTQDINKIFLKQEDRKNNIIKKFILFYLITNIDL